MPNELSLEFLLGWVVERGRRGMWQSWGGTCKRYENTHMCATVLQHATPNTTHTSTPSALSKLASVREALRPEGGETKLSSKCN